MEKELNFSHKLIIIPMLDTEDTIFDPFDIVFMRRIQNMLRDGEACREIPRFLVEPD